MGMKTDIKKNDTVVVNCGASRGQTGRVLEVIGGKGRALVEGMNLVKKTLRKTEDSPQGGISEKEASMHLSNIQLYCPDCKKGVRLRVERADGARIRKCAICGHSFDK